MSLNKRGEVFNSILIQIILIGIILVLFLVSVSGKIESRGVKQQVLEKEVALLIDSAVSGMNFEIRKINANGKVNDVKIKDGRIFISVEGLISVDGYPYFSKYGVSVGEFDDKFIVGVR